MVEFKEKVSLYKVFIYGNIYYYKKETNYLMKTKTNHFSFLFETNLKQNQPYNYNYIIF